MQKQYSLDELPAEIRLNVRQNGSGYLSVGLLFPGLVLAITGGLFVLFGPEAIYYDVAEGMDLIQFFQLYPAPIASVGVVLASLGSYVGNQSVRRHREAIEKQIKDQLAFTAEDIPKGKQLYISPLQDDYYEVVLGDVEAVASQGNRG